MIEGTYVAQKPHNKSPGSDSDSAVDVNADLDFAEDSGWDIDLRVDTHIAD